MPNLHAGSQILIGFNDLLTTHPQLSAEWCYEKEWQINFHQVTKGSHKKVWWHCPKGHNDYESTICNRVQGKGCPICSIEKRSLSRNQNRIRKNGSLSQTHPLIAAEWNFSLNNGLSPDSVTKGSSKKVWWTCENGHTYEATIANRVHGRGCPICAGKKIIPGINDLATLDLKLESEWNYSKNQGINPHTISPNSHKKAWWICPQGHEWEAEIKSRHHGSGCPYCATIKRKSRSQSEPHRKANIVFYLTTFFQKSIIAVYPPGYGVFSSYHPPKKGFHGCRSYHHNPHLTVTLSGEIDHHRVKGVLQDLDQAIDEVLPASSLWTAPASPLWTVPASPSSPPSVAADGELDRTIQVTGLPEQPARVLRLPGSNG